MARVVEQHEVGRRFVAGESFTVADIVLAGTLDWAAEEELLGGLPLSRAYMERMFARPNASPRIATVLAGFAYAGFLIFNLLRRSLSSRLVGLFRPDGFLSQHLLEMRSFQNGQAENHIGWKEDTSFPELFRRQRRHVHGDVAITRRDRAMERSMRPGSKVVPRH